MPTPNPIVFLSTAASAVVVERHDHWIGTQPCPEEVEFDSDRRYLDACVGNLGSRRFRWRHTAPEYEYEYK